MTTVTGPERIAPLNRPVPVEEPVGSRQFAGWQSGERQFMAQGEGCATAPVHDATAVGRWIDELARCSALLDGPGVVLGALPFDARGRAALFAPTEVHQWPVRAGAGGLTVEASPVAAQPTQEGYADAVAAALTELESGALRKVVLARRVDVRAGRPVDVAALAARLRSLHPSAHVFAMPLPTGGSFVGASPELLVGKRGAAVRSHPLAGSAHRSRDLATDEENAGRLRASGKDLREHAFVVEAIADLLSPYCRTLRVPALPSLVATRTMWHLGSYIEGELRDPDVPVGELAAVLHPTPAVCGTPTDDARRLIRDLEGFDRGYYAGAVGWANAAGDGEWAVAIRCAEVEADRVRMYAGAGIVPGSDPQAEVAETTGKLRAFASALEEVSA